MRETLKQILLGLGRMALEGIVGTLGQRAGQGLAEKWWPTPAPPPPPKRRRKRPSRTRRR